MSENLESRVFKPDYTQKCDNCGQTPTVQIYDGDELISDYEMCGACVFGESRCTDPGEWDK